MMYIVPLFFSWGLVFRPIILYLYGMHRHCIYDTCDLWMVLVFFYGYVFMAMCMDVCLWMYVWVCVWGMRLGYVYGYRVSILREAWFNKYRGLPLLGARFHHHWDLLASRGPFHHHWDLLLHEAHFIIIGTYSFTRPISANFWDLLLHEAHFSKFWDLLLHEAHFSKSWVLLFHEAHLDDFPNFSNFS
jgi:hypothetical protein